MISVKGNIVDVSSGKAEPGELFIENGLITDNREGREPDSVLDFEGKFISPGFIDAHVHIESSMLTPSGFVRAVLPRGTAAVVTDPHEIANVCGMDGIRFMIKDSERSLLESYFTAPSCVPATHMETSGAKLGEQEIKELLAHERVVALGEVMNFPGVVASEHSVMAKIEASRKAGKPVDGHAPGLSGEALRKYINAGISTDHECTSLDEAQEKLSLGMKVMVRCGSSMDNLEALAPLIRPENASSLFLVSDDIHPETILKEGHLDRVLRKAVALGADPFICLRLVSLNPARHYSLKGLGSLEPGSRATFAVLDDMKDFRVHAMYVDGEPVAMEGRLTRDWEKGEISQSVLSSVKVPEITEDSLKVPSEVPSEVNLLGPGGSWSRGSLESDGTHLLPDPSRDILPIAVVERHRFTGNIGKGFLKGFGLKEGAFASTVAHDSHNIICTGTSYADMLHAIDSLKESGGGLVAVREGKVLGRLELPVAGLMSIQDAGEVAKRLEGLHNSAMELGCSIKSPFMELAFLALPVIPELRLTDRGLVDVKSFRITDVKV